MEIGRRVYLCKRKDLHLGFFKFFISVVGSLIWIPHTVFLTHTQGYKEKKKKYHSSLKFLKIIGQKVFVYEQPLQEYTCSNAL